MEDETIRTLITGLTSIISVGLTVLFAWKTHIRKDRIRTLESSLRTAYTEFKMLYETESGYLGRLEELGEGTSNSLKVKFRKEVTDRYGDEKILLTPGAIAKKVKELGL